MKKEIPEYSTRSARTFLCNLIYIESYIFCILERNPLYLATGITDF